MHRRENALHVPATRLTNSLAKLATSSISLAKRRPVRREPQRAPSIGLSTTQRRRLQLLRRYPTKLFERKASRRKLLGMRTVQS